MRLIYLYIGEGILKQFDDEPQMNFGGEYSFNYNKETSTLNMIKNNDYIEKFYGDHVEGINLVCGKNGSGKTNVLNAVVNSYSGNSNIMIYEDNNSIYVKFEHIHLNKEFNHIKKLKISFNNRLFTSCNLTDSNDFDKQMMRIEKQRINDGSNDNDKESICEFIDKIKIPTVKYSGSLNYSLFRSKPEDDLITSHRIYDVSLNSSLLTNIDCNVQESFRRYHSSNFKSTKELLKMHNEIGDKVKLNYIPNYFSITYSTKYVKLIKRAIKEISGAWEGKYLKTTNNDYNHFTTTQIETAINYLKICFFSMKTKLLLSVEEYENVETSTILDELINTIIAIEPRYTNVENGFKFFFHEWFNNQVIETYSKTKKDLLKGINNYFLDFDGNDGIKTELYYSSGEVQTIVDYLAYYNAGPCVQADWKYWGASTGLEKRNLLFASLLKGFEKVKNDGFHSNNSELIRIVLDEPEIHFHPSWKQEFINDLIIFIEVTNEYLFNSLCKFDIFIATNGPIMLSDIPLNNINLLESVNHGDCSFKSDYRIRVKDKNTIKNTFAGNIHDLYKDAFFLENSNKGKFAISKIAKYFKKLDTYSEKLWHYEVNDKVLYLENYLSLKEEIVEFKKEIAIIGDKIISTVITEKCKDIRIRLDALKIERN